MVKPLDIKLLRDFRRLWAQALAIALVAAAGVGTMLVIVGTYRSLIETRQAYYERYDFADIFANSVRSPNRLLDNILSINGVIRADIRIQESAILDIPYMSDPASAKIISIPDRGEPNLNRLFLVKGHLPNVEKNNEIIISQAFANAHYFKPGDSFFAIMGGVKRKLVISAIALSPEFIYTVREGEMFPDDKRFGIIWMRYSNLASAYNLNGAFNFISLKTDINSNQSEIIDKLDSLLKPYGGTGAYDRNEQSSHAYIDSELTGLKAMSYVLPPIFLLVAAFLVNMTLARLIALEREQIGLLKAIGYKSSTIAYHYMKLSLLIASVGIIFGWIYGALAGRGMAQIYAQFFKFPFLLFQDRADIYAISAFAALIAALFGALQAVKTTIRLSPAIAMSPPAPPVYRQFFLDKLGLSKYFSQGIVMATRNLTRRPIRAILTTLGISLATGLLIAGIFINDSIEYMIEASYYRADRQQASIVSAKPLTPSAMQEVKRLPGVIMAEPFRIVPVKIINGIHQKRTILTGKPNGADLSRVIDLDLNPIKLPQYGVAMPQMLADILDIKISDYIEVELLDGSDKKLKLQVSQIIQQFMGLGVYMEISSLNKALGESSLSNGANISFDSNKTDELFLIVKTTPAIAGITLLRKSLQMLRQTFGESIGIMRDVMVVLATIIVFGVVYNSMRIQLSERARELASLRVLGFTKREVSIILLSEIFILTMLAIPIGLLFGYSWAGLLAHEYQTELFRMPLIIERSTYGFSALIVFIAMLISAFIVQRRISKLDLIAVLKTRD